MNISVVVDENLITDSAEIEEGYNYLKVFVLVMIMNFEVNDHAGDMIFFCTTTRDGYMDDRSVCNFSGLTYLNDLHR